MRGSLSTEYLSTQSVPSGAGVVGKVVDKLNGKSTVIPTDVNVIKDTNTSSVLHRGDTRPPEQIFEKGFAPKNPNANVDLENYVNSEPSPPSQYVSTTTDAEIAEYFGTGYGTKDGFRYDLDKPDNAIDIEAELGSKALYDESEMAIPNGIECSQIIGCQPLNADGSPKGDYINNPNYENK